MSSTNTLKISTTQLLVPMSLMAFTMGLLFAFQITQILRDRDNLNQTLGRMEMPVVEGEKITKQFGGLVAGTQKLAEEGDVTAKDFVDRLKKIGVIAEPSKMETALPIPVAKEGSSPGPVKP